MRAFIGRRESGEDALMTRLIGRGAKHGSTWFGRAGDVTKQPLAWAGAAAVSHDGSKGPSGRRSGQRRLPVGDGDPSGGEGGCRPAPTAGGQHAHEHRADYLLVPLRPLRQRTGVHLGGGAGGPIAVRSFVRRNLRRRMVFGAQPSPLSERHLRRRRHLGLVGFVGWKLWPPQRRLRAEAPALPSDHDRAEPTEAGAPAAPAPAALWSTVATEESGR